MKLNTIATITILIGLFSTLYGSGNETISSFSKAKKTLNKKVYNKKDLRYAFYSNCKYNNEKYTYKSGKKRWKLVVDKQSCGYIPRTKSKRANFIEYEHIVPAHAFGHNLTCWNKGNDSCYSKKKDKHYKGRKCCSKVSKQFKLMQADIYNLVPAIGELNADRSNFTFTELNGEPRKYGEVNFEIDFKARKVEPPEYSKGQIARTYLYFKKTYNLPISKKQMKLFRV
ncbi:endonuclease I [Poseidonibacter ostreae]|uniref:endonuclease n=1 Tax=Poseidonibacter ostreae TaxID=2654171 RepID=UPI001264105D|nr:endonuclease [Poseidonibacter ostreae]KAB7884890.1 endonuclease I [Poseidonibacter ostreae]